MKAEWCIYDRPLSKELCEMIVTQATRLVRPEPGLVGLDAHVDGDYRACTCRWLHEDAVDPEDGGETWRQLFAYLRRAMDIANLDLFGFDCTFIRHIQFTTYQAGSEKGECGTDDRFEEHKDTFWLDHRYVSHRKLSITVQLSHPDDYDGGDFLFHKEIAQPGPARLRPQGTILIFPAPFYHRVTPITRGTRHALVAWYEGPAWR